jgi:hypothetical protein
VIKLKLNPKEGVQEHLHLKSQNLKKSQLKKRKILRLRRLQNPKVEEDVNQKMLSQHQLLLQEENNLLQSLKTK